MRIPKSFKLHGQTIKVKYVTNLVYKQGAFGQAKYVENRIELQPNTKDVPVPYEQVEETFLHEMIHHILNHMGGKYESELKSDEEFVEGFAQLLHQGLTTQEGYLIYDEPTGEVTRADGNEAE
jgi:hypothetical protein